MIGLIALIVLAILHFIFDVNIPWWGYAIAAAMFLFSGPRYLRNE